MSNVILHPSYHSRVNSAIDSVVTSIRRTNLKSRLACLADGDFIDVIQDAVRGELIQPSSGFGIVLKRLRAAA